jgi:hypothetical protein
LNCRQKAAIIAGMADETTPADNVVPIPPRREALTELVREIAADDTRWFLIVQPDGRGGVTWNYLVNRRTVLLCLSEGYVLDDHATRDKEGNWRFRIARVCAGVNVTIECALEANRVQPRLYVLTINGEFAWPPL